MDFSEIKSVQDLINQNEGLSDMKDKVESLTEMVYKEDPDVGMSVAIDILLSLLSLHKDVMDRHIADGEAEMAALWTMDVNRIDNAITILKDVKL